MVEAKRIRNLCPNEIINNFTPHKSWSAKSLYPQTIPSCKPNSLAEFKKEKKLLFQNMALRQKCPARPGPEAHPDRGLSPVREISP
jgi:hypothetical protein